MESYKRTESLRMNLFYRMFIFLLGVFSVPVESHIFTKMCIFVHFLGPDWWNSVVIQST